MLCAVFLDTHGNCNGESRITFFPSVGEWKSWEFSSSMATSVQRDLEPPLMTGLPIRGIALVTKYSDLEFSIFFLTR